MQPNQQDQNPQITAQQSFNNVSSTNVPDYLHLDPVEIEQPKKSKKKLTALFVILSLLISLVICVWYGWNWIASTSERNFYQALSNIMSLKYVERKYVLKINNSISTLNATDMLDCSSQTICKRQIEYTNTINSPPQNQAIATSIGGNIVVSEDGYYTRITSSSPPISGLPVLNQWYKLSSQPVGSVASLLSFQALLPTGNYSNEQITKIINIMQTNHIFTLDGSSEAVIDGDKTTKYQIKSDTKKLNQLSATVDGMTGQKSTNTTETDADKVEINLWVSNSTNTIKRIITEYEGATNGSVTADVSFMYPKNVKISVPSDAKPL